jgi:tetratricopeptide (TPR) repeat protein
MKNFFANLLMAARAVQVLSAAGVLALTAVLLPAHANDQEDADALFATQNWASAAAAYEALLDEDEENANNWLNLGQARYQLEDYKSARDAYRKAIELGYQPLPRARIWLARALMSLGDRKGALKQLEEVAKSGGPSYRALQAIPEFESLSNDPRYIAVIDALRPCNTEEYHQFDFWLGEWDVTPANAQSATAENVISLQQEGCVVLEEYRTGAFTGMSINFYDSTTQKWHQTWMSNAGGSVYLEGGLNEDGAMEMTDKDLPISAAARSINRVTWTPNEDGSVRQYWEFSSDGGETWSVSFDGLYVKKKSE